MYNIRALICELTNQRKNEWNSDSFSQQRILRNACAKNHLCRYPRIATAPSPSAARTLYYYIAGAPNTTHNRVPQNLAAVFFFSFFFASVQAEQHLRFFLCNSVRIKEWHWSCRGENSNMSFCMRHYALGGARRQQLAHAGSKKQKLSGHDSKGFP